MWLSTTRTTISRPDLRAAQVYRRAACIPAESK
jgi:hypothetical protein